MLHYRIRGLWIGTVIIVICEARDHPFASLFFGPGPECGAAGWWLFGAAGRETEGGAVWRAIWWAGLPQFRIC